MTTGSHQAGGEVQEFTSSCFVVNRGSALLAVKSDLFLLSTSVRRLQPPAGVSARGAESLTRGLT